MGIPANTVAAPLSGSPALSAMAYTDQNTQRLTNLSNLAGGKYRRRRFKGGAGIVVPLGAPTPGPQVGTGNNTVTGVTVNAFSTALQGGANAQFDGCVGQGAGCTTGSQAGGSHISLINNQNGDMQLVKTGGRRRRQSRKSKKSKKSRKSRKSKRSKK